MVVPLGYQIQMFGSYLVLNLKKSFTHCFLSSIFATCKNNLNYANVSTSVISNILYNLSVRRPIQHQNYYVCIKVEFT